jgi:hypothetical protein
MAQCGVVLSRRSLARGDTISIWNQTGDDDELIKTVTHQLECIDIVKGLVVQYLPHQVSIYFSTFFEGAFRFFINFYYYYYCYYYYYFGPFFTQSFDHRYCSEIQYYGHALCLKIHLTSIPSNSIPGNLGPQPPPQAT